MHKIAVVCLLMLLTPIAGQGSFAQDSSSGQQQAAKPQNESPAPNTAQAGHFYRLDFTVEEVGPDSKVTNSRVYSTDVGVDVRELLSIRTGSRVPIATGPYNANGKDGSQVATQFQYVDMGVNFDVRDVHELGRQLSLNLTADLSGLAGTDPNTRQPIIRHNRWQGICLIPTGKATIVFSSDSLDSNGSTRILVTATRLQ